LQWLEDEWDLHFEFEAAMEEEPTSNPVHSIFDDLEEDEVDSGVTTGNTPTFVPRRTQSPPSPSSRSIPVLGEHSMARSMSMRIVY